MKREEKNRAIELRKEGKSMRDIAETLGVSKGSVSLWVRDIPLTKTQRRKLSANGFSIDAIEKRRLRRIENTRQRREVVMRTAGHDFDHLSPHMLKIIGIALYWGEGGKTGNTVRLSNSDPVIIKIMMRFFREVCAVPEEKMRGHVHTFSHANVERAERYWSTLSTIPRKRFFKTYCKPSIAGQQKRDTLPYGTFQIYVHDTELFFKLKGWIRRMEELSDGAQ